MPDLTDTIKSNQMKPNQMKPNQIKSNQMKSKQIKYYTKIKGLHKYFLKVVNTLIH